MLLYIPSILQSIAQQLVIILGIQIESTDIVLNVINADTIPIVPYHKGMQYPLWVFHVHGILRIKITIQLPINPGRNRICRSNSPTSIPYSIILS